MLIPFRKIAFSLLLLFLNAAAVSAQPIDLLIPRETETDPLTQELRDLHDVQRDLALEKLTKVPTKLDAYIELGELRLTQGKLIEAKRFFEAALELSPKNMRANHGLAMVYYNLGDFDKTKQLISFLYDYHPLSDYNREYLEACRSRVNKSITAGLYVREDSRGFQEIMKSLDAVYPFTKYKKTEIKYKAEFWTHEDETNQSIDSRIFSGTLNYKADENNIFSFTYSPETIKNHKTVNGYSIQGLMGSELLKLGLRSSKNTFKDNLFTIKNDYIEESNAITLYGDLHPRTRIMQSFSVSDISDNNSKQRYDTSLIYSFYKNKTPFMTANLSYWQSSYDKQTNSKGELLNYWAPSDFKGFEFALNWEKSLSQKWWVGLEGNYIVNKYTFGTLKDAEDKGPGGSLFCNYKLPEGSIFFTLSERSRYYFTERRCEVYGSFNF